jgi:hypothetical protein
MQTDTITEKKPSLLRQIVDEVDTLDEAAMEDVLINIKRKKAIEITRQLEEKLKDSWEIMTEDEIANFVSEERRSYYLANTEKFTPAK